jgi:DNA-binding transcriptional LysR family regulator
LLSGQADLALGTPLEPGNSAGIQSRLLGEITFVFAVAPHHPLAKLPQPLSDEVVQRHRAVAVADSVPRGSGLTIGLLAGQDVLTVPTMRAKLEAQLRGLGVGFLPEPMARPFVETGRLVPCRVQRPTRVGRMSYAWRDGGALGPGLALRWWLQQLESPTTRAALLERHAGPLLT